MKAAKAPLALEREATGKVSWSSVMGSEVGAAFFSGGRELHVLPALSATTMSEKLDSPSLPAYNLENFSTLLLLLSSSLCF